MSAEKTKQHIRVGEVAEDGACMVACGKVAERGEWVAGATYQGLMILGGDASDYCPTCVHEWLRMFNRRDE